MTLKPAVVKRIERSSALSSGQERHGRCLICGNSFDDCPHDIGQIDTLLAMYRAEKLAKEVSL